MLLERIEALARTGLALDTETDLIQPGYLVTRLVCGSASWLAPGPKIEGTLLDKDGTAEIFAKALDDESVVLIGANIAFDIAVIARRFVELGLDAMPSIYRAFEQGRIYDLQIAEALNAIAQGHLGRDPRTGGELKNPETGRRGRYSLSICVDQVLGRTDAKANDEWRMRYAELEPYPIADWPQEARDYPVDDARNTLECALAQTGHLPKLGAQHEWGNLRRPDGTVYSACIHCQATRFGTQCTRRSPHRNLHDLSNQVYSAFALHLGAATGFPVDQSWVDVIQKHVRREHAAHVQPFIDAGIFRGDGSENRAVLKRRVAIAYGADQACPVCQGTGKIPKPNQKTLRCPDCKGRCVPWKGGGTIKAPTVAGCATCASTGRVPHPKPEYMACCEIARLPDGSENTEVEREITCDGTGMVLTDDVPRTKTEGIGFGADVLHESGDEFLMSLGDLKEDQKTDGVYIPYLRRARVPVAGHGEDCPHRKREYKEHCVCLGPYRDVPLTLMPNVLLETGRVSYAGSIQQFPRAPGFWAKREVPADYVLQPGEEFA